MTESLTVFGFGSYFRSVGDPKDIDLLLLHSSSNPASCQFAIDCKEHLRRALPDADVVMLSKAEAGGNQFLTRSQAVVLGAIHTGNIEAQMGRLARQILSRAASSDVAGKQPSPPTDSEDG